MLSALKVGRPSAAIGVFLNAIGELIGAGAIRRPLGQIASAHVERSVESDPRIRERAVAGRRGQPIPEAAQQFGDGDDGSMTLAVGRSAA